VINAVDPVFVEPAGHHAVDLAERREVIAQRFLRHDAVAFAVTMQAGRRQAVSDREAGAGCPG